MDLIVETKQYIFSASTGFDYVAIYLCNNLNQSPEVGSYHYLTKKEVSNLIEYLKQDNYGDGRDNLLIDKLTNMEMLMQGKEKATFHFW